MPLAVCATPIGNLDDVTLRVLAELREADVVLAEDTRHTRGLLARHGIEARLVSYHEHNEAARVAPSSCPGSSPVSGSRSSPDAGLPGVSDPGARLVRAALDAGVPVTVLPGPSAVETALVASGLVGERYAFLGFLPRREAERAALWTELASWSWPAVAFESPQRLGASLRSLAAAAPEREVAVCRELTKRFEEVVRGPAAERRGAVRGRGEGRDHGRDRARRRAAVVRGGREAAGRRRRPRGGRNAAARRRRGRLAPDGRVPKRPLPRIFVTTL